jgi:DNA invertase Pin-like site-specific DNA recombinase
MERIWEAEAGFRSLTEAIDTTTAPGRIMMQMVGVFAESERAILRERTMAGLDAARKRGRIGGRRPKLRPQQQEEIVSMVAKGTKTAADVARLFDVHPATVSRLFGERWCRYYRGECVTPKFISGQLAKTDPLDALPVHLAEVTVSSFNCS